MRLWKKGGELDPRVEGFTIGNDAALDQRLLRHDCRASRAHAEMLCAIGVLDAGERDRLVETLHEIERLDAEGRFPIGAGDEDCHSAIEGFLTEKLGDAGRRIHTARSRNDQVLTALRLYEKEALAGLARDVAALRAALAAAIGRFGAIAMPGYTHTRKAMPTTVGTWLGCFAAALDDDLGELAHVAARIDRSPLGTAAGFGVPLLPIDREMTARAMGFAGIIENPIHAQHGRGKLEAAVLSACTQILYDLNRLASDLMLFSIPELGYVVLPERLCTGSSMMPQKRNPDVLELIRGKYHVVVAEEAKIKGVAANLVSGYNRDLQLTKEPLFTGLDTTAACLTATRIVVEEMEIDADACGAGLGDDLLATARAYALVSQGVPFREAYRIVGRTTAYRSTVRGQGAGRT
jgi:argininosuccinate lyase